MLKLVPGCKEMLLQRGSNLSQASCICQVAFVPRQVAFVKLHLANCICQLAFGKLHLSRVYGNTMAMPKNSAAVWQCCGIAMPQIWSRVKGNDNVIQKSASEAE